MKQNGIPMINGILYSWANVVVTIAGVPLTGITAVEYGDKQEITNRYGAGRHPVGRSKGRITPSAKLTLYQEEVEAIQRRAPKGRLQDLGLFDIIVSYIKEDGSPIVVDKIHNCGFTSNERKSKEGDTGHEVDLEIIPSHISWGASA